MRIIKKTEQTEAKIFVLMSLPCLHVMDFARGRGSDMALQKLTAMLTPCEKDVSSSSVRYALYTGG
jgi:hypothetical protein